MVGRFLFYRIPIEYKSKHANNKMTVKKKQLLQEEKDIEK